MYISGSEAFAIFMMVCLTAVILKEVIVKDYFSHRFNASEQKVFGKCKFKRFLKEYTKFKEEFTFSNKDYCGDDFELYKYFSVSGKYGKCLRVVEEEISAPLLFISRENTEFNGKAMMFNFIEYIKYVIWFDKEMSKFEDYAYKLEKKRLKGTDIWK